MKRISSRLTRINKWLGPTFTLGFLIVIAGVMLSGPKDQQPPPIFVILVPVLFGTFMFFIFRKMAWDLADEVIDLGDALSIRFGSTEDRIPLENIINVSYAYMMNPSRVTLTLRSPSRFGSEVSFGAPMVWIPFRRDPAVLELIQRIDSARQAAK